MKTNFNFARREQQRRGRDPSGETLADQPVGSRAVVVAVDTSTPAGRRLADLGLVAGTVVHVARRAPLGDPTVYELRGTQLCLRRSEARRVRVRVAAGADAAGGAAR